MPGLPHRRIEAWKYTDLRVLMRDAKPLAGPPCADKQAFADVLPGIEARRIAIVNGAYVPALSDAKDGDPGVALVELFAWLGDQLGARQDQVGDGQDIALALNAAFMTGGVVLRVRKGARVEKPIHLAHVFSGDAPAAMFPRTLGTSPP